MSEKVRVARETALRVTASQKVRIAGKYAFPAAVLKKVRITKICAGY
jgi:hypothetical protein